MFFGECHGRTSSITSQNCYEWTIGAHGYRPLWGKGLKNVASFQDKQRALYRYKSPNFAIFETKPRFGAIWSRIAKGYRILYWSVAELKFCRLNNHCKLVCQTEWRFKWRVHWVATIGKQYIICWFRPTRPLKTWDCRPRFHKLVQTKGWADF